MARALLVSLFVVFAGVGCTSSFPPGSFDWGHGAAPLDEGQTRIQVGGGGGAGVGVVGTSGGGSVLPPGPDYGLIAGGGGGLAVEHQLLPTLLVRGEANAGCQTSALNDATADVPSETSLICPAAVYLGGQANPEGNRNFALRLRIGGGGDFFAIDGGALIPAPYIATQGAVVFSNEFADFEPYVDLHAGAKVGALLAPVASAGVSGGAEYHFGESLSAYALARTDVVFITILPSVSANVQAGVFFVF